MRISRIHVVNFRSLRDISIDFEDVTTFIGPNGAGKSTVLRALNWFFNGTKNGDLSDKDCSIGATDREILVEVTFKDLSAADRDELGKYAPPSVDSFTAWKTRTAAGEEYLSANAKGFSLFSAIKEATAASDKKERYRALRDERSDLKLPSAATAGAIDTAMTEWEASHTTELESLPENLQTNFFGFNSGAKMSGLFDFVLVTADFRASEEALDSKASIIGKILERTIDRSAADDEIAKIVEQSRIDQQQVYKTKFTGDLKTITDELNRVVSSYSPGRSVSVTPSDIELKAPRTTFAVTVLDGPTETSVEGQGHGFQRTLLISALQLLAQSGAAGAGGVICLAIEEPELFQHPIQAQAFARVLRALAEDPKQQIQVTYATHSPYFVESRNFHQLRRLTRDSGELPSVAVHASSLSDVKTRLDGFVAPDVVDRQLDGTVSKQLPVAVFANRVLLVEGTTEEAVLNGIADREAIGQLETLGISVVAAGGKGNLLLIHGILSSLGIPTHCMFDSDAGFEARAKASGKSSAKIESDIKSLVKLNRDLLGYFELPPADFPPETEHSAVTILSDHLEELLTREWPEWHISCAEFEEQAGITFSKNQFAYRIATRLSVGAPSPLLKRVLARSKALDAAAT
jgi:putative ATP-dependent endonuclease of OLD family